MAANTFGQMAVPQGVHGMYTLYTTSEKLYLQPLEMRNELLTVDRLSNTISIEVNSGQIPADATSRLIYGIVGIINLIAGRYLILITRASKMGDILGQPIMRVEETDMISFSKTTLHLTEKQMEFNNQYLAMVKSVLDTPYFYYSLTYDLTHALQTIFTEGPNLMSRSLFQRADKRFVWNAFLLRDLENRPEMQAYCVPLIHGFVAINMVTVNRKIFNLSLVSRRSVQRAGTRLFTRGVDNDGAVANFVETEQIVECHAGRSSFVQIRGSIPLFWQQLPDLRYKPPPSPLPGVDQDEGYRRHVAKLLEKYPKVTLVSLIDHKGKEEALEKLLTETVTKNHDPRIRYESFDFHHECRKMRWDRLSILLEKVNQDYLDMGFFQMAPDQSIARIQHGFFRTNCIDSLDRTNVVQNLFARLSLQEQLIEFSILSPGEKLEDHAGFYSLYRNVWADHADIVSIQYSGTPALKTDYTRTGKRTQIGKVKDGINSMMRYYKNNFADGFRQDSIDLFLGNHQIDENEGKLVRCPLEEQKDWKYLALPVILLGSVSMFFFSIFIPTEHSTETFIYLFFWSAMATITSLVMFYYGGEFVDFPKLTGQLKPPSRGSKKLDIKAD